MCSGAGVSWGATDEASLAKLLRGVATYRGGQSRSALAEVTRLVAEASKEPARARGLATQLAALLDDPKVSREAKIFVCRKLALIAGSEQVPVLARRLDDPELSHMARYALQPMPDPAVDAALRAAAQRLKGKLLVGVLNSIGERRDQAATGQLAGLLRDRNVSVATAAAQALGKLGTARAADALLTLHWKARGPLSDAIDDALLGCAAALAVAGNRDRAFGICNRLLGQPTPVHVRVGVLRRFRELFDTSSYVQTLTATITGGETELAPAAVGLLAETPGPEALRALTGLLPRARPSAQRAVIEALARRGDRAAAPAVAALARDGTDAAARLAAARALGRLGGASAADLLGRMAASDNEALRDAARASMRDLRGAEIEAAIVGALKGAPEEARVALIRGLGDRRATAFAAQVADVAASDKSAAVRRQCFAVLAELADAGQMQRLVDLMLREPDTATRGTAERTVLAVARRVKDPAKRVQPVLAAHAKASGKARGTTLRVLARLGGAQALEAVLADVGSEDKAVGEAAFRALADWPDDRALPALAGILNAPGDPTRHILALRGYIRLVGSDRARPVERSVGMYGFALRAASRPEEKKLVLAALPGVESSESLKLAQACAKDPALKAEAEQAIRRIQLAIRKPIPSASRNAAAVGLAVDGDRETRWKSLVNQSKGAGIWFQLDLRAEVTLRRIVLHGHRLKAADYPRQVEVYLSADAKTWGKPVVVAEGKSATVTIDLPPARGRYLKLVSTGTAGHNWSIYEIELETE